MNRIIGVVFYALAGVSLLLAGCAATPLHVPMLEPGACETAQGRAVSEEACGTMLGGAIPIGMTDRYERAYNGLLRQAPGKCVTDIKMTEELKYIFIGWRFCTYFTGMAYPKRISQATTAY